MKKFTEIERARIDFIKASNMESRHSLDAERRARQATKLAATSPAMRSGAQPLRKCGFNVAGTPGLKSSLVYAHPPLASINPMGKRK